MEITSFYAITVLCYLAAAAVKAAGNADKWIPVICGALGAVLGAVAFYIVPEGFPASDVFTAVAVGVVSGLAATGINQIYKQMTS